MTQSRFALLNHSYCVIRLYFGSGWLMINKYTFSVHFIWASQIELKKRNYLVMYVFIFILFSLNKSCMEYFRFEFQLRLDWFVYEKVHNNIKYVKYKYFCILKRICIVTSWYRWNSIQNNRLCGNIRTNYFYLYTFVLDFQWKSSKWI